ncbi:MAG: hypothetical protein JW715_14835 [Sedimentisphaerales bacterium]|nr:hypothetical protein [Sedimentisphaerales bacterium]
MSLFVDKYVNSSWVGVEINAQIVITAMRGLPNNAFGEFLRTEPTANWQDRLNWLKGVPLFQ